MKVMINDLSVAMEVKNKGVEFRVHDNQGNFQGDCYVTKSGLTWCQGKTLKANGISVSWEEFIEWMNS
ncbi:hypothetical protein [Thalassospira profundimaris]|uniref:Uncharacterized protein n=1 Tax=Thalassospira profundimaris TaxID=502049 RepID=A0A367WXU3_9PROT|nr:hypothetical protein [Thalassospira profundimaris]RCK46273.1 hypothetical protein TH30_10720 [Thalassospira profundimaris]